MAFSAEDLSLLSRLLDEPLDPYSVTELEDWLQALKRVPAACRHNCARCWPTATAADRHRLRRRPLARGARRRVHRLSRRPGRPLPVGEIGRGRYGERLARERAQASLKRRIALKLPRLAFGAGLAERISLSASSAALLEHPNIARLYDAGVDARGRPYLALEYIDGQPLDAWCEAEALTIPQRIRLFLQVARAVAYAHGRLVVHRYRL